MTRGDPRVVEAAGVALRRYGTSASGSRLLNGTTALHLQLEAELADHTAPRPPCSPPRG